MDVRLNLLRDMLRIRMVEEEIAARYSNQMMRCPTHLSTGQEPCRRLLCRHCDPPTMPLALIEATLIISAKEAR